MKLFVIKPKPKEYATMHESTTPSVALPSISTKDVMTEVLREGARRMLATAIKAEVADWAGCTDDRVRTTSIRRGGCSVRGGE